MPRAPQHIDINTLPRESHLDGTWQRVGVRGDHSLVTYNWMDPAMPPQPIHSHDFDQLAMIISGAMEFTVDDQKFVVEEGQVLVIPSNVPHTAVAVGDKVALNVDVFAPPREDFLYLTEHQGHDWPGTDVLSAADRAAVEDLLLLWSDHLDRGDAGDVADLLIEDSVVTGLGPDRLGPDGMREWARARPKGRRTHHHVTNLRYSGRPDGTIVGRAYVALYVVTDDNLQPRLEFVGEYNDTIVRSPHGLRFARRNVTPLH